MRLLICAAVLLWTPALVEAQGKGKGKDKGNPQAGRVQVDIRFGAAEISAIRGYYAGSPGKLPGALSKGDLPPGLERQLVRNGQLPPGLRKKLQPLPPDLDRRLPGICGGCRRGVVGPWAVLINDVTNVIYDIIDLTRL